MTIDEPKMGDEGQVPESIAPETETEVTTDAEENGQTEEEKKGASQRIRELNQRAKTAEEQVKSLSDRINEITQQEEDKPFYPSVTEGETISPERYQSDITKTADSIVKLRMKQYEAETRIKADSAEALRTYSQLDPKSTDFDPEISEAITNAVEDHVRVNPYSAQVKKVVDRLMRPYAKAIERSVGQVTEQVAKQVTQTALRPTQVKKIEKTAADKSIAELEAELGMVVS